MNKKLIYMVAIDHESSRIKNSDYAQWSIASWELYCKKYGFDFVVIRESQLTRPIWQKSMIYEHGHGYDFIGIVDSDTIVSPTAPDVSIDKNNGFYAVYDLCDLNWVMQSIKDRQRFFPNVELDLMKYFNAGEDNYMKTTDAKKSGDQVLASQFINERSAINAGMTADQMCIGHAMEMDPSYHQVILFEIARSLMTRQIFPDSPLKYMCNTKYKTGDIFTSHAIDTIFNFIGSLTDQGMILLGMPTEAVHTPFLQDRSISIRNANYVLGGSFGISSEVAYRKDGVIAKFSEKVLDDALNFLERVNKVGIFKAIEKAYFADVVRTPEGGKGGNGVFAVDRAVYLNPFFKLMGSRI